MSIIYGGTIQDNNSTITLGTEINKAFIRLDAGGIQLKAIFSSEVAKYFSDTLLKIADDLQKETSHG